MNSDYINTFIKNNWLFRLLLLIKPVFKRIAKNQYIYDYVNNLKNKVFYKISFDH